MNARPRDFYRQRAIQRQRDPDLDARLAASSAAARARFNAALASFPLIRQLSAEALAMQQDTDMIFMRISSASAAPQAGGIGKVTRSKSPTAKGCIHRTGPWLFAAGG